MQETNTLFAALVLAAQATVLRHDADGEPVTSAMALVRCGRLGEPRRNSDPQIAAAVNDAAATGAEISLQDPFGLYIDRLLLGACGGPTAGIRPSSGSSSGNPPAHAARQLRRPAGARLPGRGWRPPTDVGSSSARSSPSASSCG